MLAFQLYQLQQIDNTCDALRAEIQRLEGLLADQTALAEAEAALSAAKARLHRAQQAWRAAEAEAEAVRQKLRRTEDALYSGRVRNPKELQDLQREAEALKRLLAQREDAELETMLAAEEAELALQQAEAHLAEQQHQRRQQTARWQGDLSEKQSALQAWEKRRQALTASLPPETLQVYERLRQKRHGLAVSTVHESACDACGAPLTPQRLQAARGGDQLTFCATCGRILYVP